MMLFLSELSMLMRMRRMLELEEKSLGKDG